MPDKSQTNAENSAQSSNPVALPLSSWINVVLSFVFVVFGVTFALWPAFWQFGRNWVAEESIATVGWVIFGVGVVLGLVNAIRYYSRVNGKS
jgi:hypothetical protein